MCTIKMRQNRHNNSNKSSDAGNGRTKRSGKKCVTHKMRARSLARSLLWYVCLFVCARGRLRLRKRKRLVVCVCASTIGINRMSLISNSAEKIARMAGGSCDRFFCRCWSLSCMHFKSHIAFVCIDFYEEEEKKHFYAHEFNMVRSYESRMKNAWKSTSQSPHNKYM